MIEIETTAKFRGDKGAGLFMWLLSQHGFSNSDRMGRSVTVSYDGHGSRLEVHELIEQCEGHVVRERFSDDD